VNPLRCALPQALALYLLPPLLCRYQFYRGTVTKVGRAGSHGRTRLRARPSRPPCAAVPRRRPALGVPPALALNLALPAPIPLPCTPGRPGRRQNFVCDASAECVGIHGTSNGWALFGAAKREGVVGKVRVVGENLQPWVPLPSGM
jgi:hypothetical protein